MATAKEIADRADLIFMDTYTVQDILKGDTIAMHGEAWARARYELEGPTCGNIDKELLGTLLDTTITEIYEVGEDYVEIYTEGTKVRAMALIDIIILYQKEMSKQIKVDVPIEGSDIEAMSDVILENNVIRKKLCDFDGNKVILSFMKRDEYEQRRR